MSTGTGAEKSTLETDIMSHERILINRNRPCLMKVPVIFQCQFFIVVPLNVLSKIFFRKGRMAVSIPIL